jgi:hypothetical protein
MFDTFMREWGLPVFGLLFGIIGYLYFWYAARQFDRKYGRHDSTRGG